jgi:hypothetical protein
MDEDTGAGRRRGRFRQAGASLRGGVAKAAAKRGFAEPDVLMRWPEIVGADLAPVCRPVKVSYGRSPALGATLVVEADGPRAIEIEHLAPRILERVNQHYGYRAVSRLSLTQAGGFADAQAPFAGKPAGEQRAPDPAAARRAAELVRGIRDERLRATLERLGAHVLSREGKAPR